MDCALRTLEASVCQNVRHVTGFEIKQLAEFTEMLPDASLNTHACLNGHHLMHANSCYWFNYENAWFNLSGMMLKRDSRETAVLLKVVWRIVVTCQHSIFSWLFVFVHYVLISKKLHTLLRRMRSDQPTLFLPPSLSYLFLPISLIPGCQATADRISHGKTLINTWSVPSTFFTTARRNRRDQSGPNAPKMCVWAFHIH